MSKVLKPGDKVSWKTSQGTTEGTVEKKVTSATKINGYVAKPTEAAPEFVVKSAKSGKKAVHKPDALTKK
jgi:hypothetical protein